MQNNAAANLQNAFDVAERVRWIFSNQEAMRLYAHINVYSGLRFAKICMIK